jgi:phosphoribosyl 1,2-cyclic phosphate phosphodiesterase
MKIRYIGTGAAEGWPAVFCQCAACRAARRLGGRNIRHRSSALIDGSLLIDLPADIYSQSLAYGIDLSAIKSFLITHNHEDHFYPHELTNMTEAYAQILDGIPAKLYGSVTVTDAAAKALEGYDINGLLELVEVKAFQEFTAGRYTITPLPANHGAGVSFNYLICSGGKTMLYAHDTGWPKDAVWEFLQGKRLNFVSMDGTCIDAQHYESHMTLDEDIAMKRRLISMGCADESTVFVSNHFSHNGLLLHEEIEARLLPHGILAAFDGMEMEF